MRKERPSGLSSASVVALVAALAALAGSAADGCAHGGESLATGAGGAAGTSSSSHSVAGSTGTGTGTGGMGTGGSDSLGGGCVRSSDVVLAFDQLYFGDTDWNGNSDPNAWALFGLNIDNLDTTGPSSATCQPNDGADANVVFPDGPNGLDNSFGKNVLPTFVQNIPGLSTEANTAIYNGDFTIIVRLIGLGPGASQSPIVAKVYGGDDLAVLPNFNGKDCWPVTPESLSSPTDIESATLTYPTSTLVTDTWDSVTFGDLDLTLKVLSFEGHATIHHARIVMPLDAGHDATNMGIISGVLDTEEFVAVINQLMGNFDPSECGSALMTMIDAVIMQASDIMNDGTQNPAAVCNGISIGLGFKATKVEFGAIGAPLPTMTNPCP
jgi:hypothetical protein